jgi:2-oxoisovalerate dehydrogenase E1 component
MSQSPTPEELRRLLEVMLESRHGDLRQESLNRQGKGHFHVSGMGHEAMAVVGLAMRDGDMAALYYRDRAVLHGRGVSTRELALDYFAKRDSSTGGRQMPAHGTYRKYGLWSVSTPTGAQLLPACGMAWGMQMDAKQSFCVTSIGDAATRQGDFYEAVCFARERALPLLCIVEDNGFGISSRTRGINPLALGALDAGCWREVDGTSVLDMHAAVSESVEQLRARRGPYFLWVKLERLSSHTSSDDQKLYRSADEMARLELGDPVLRLRDLMIASGWLTMDAYLAIDAEIKERVRAEYVAAERATDPSPDDLERDVFSRESRIDETPVLPAGKYRMGDTVNLTLRAALERTPGTILFGQDIEDPKGGVFRLTKGLTEAFPGQVNNSPLAESTILGVAVGLASYGKRPVFELQFIDFIAPAWNQLVTNWSTLRWRSNGEWSCPAVLYAPCGAYLPGGSLWHSQTNEAPIAHFPGIQIVMPSTAEDASGLMWSAMQSDDPTIVLLPKHLLWVEQECAKPIVPVPLGIAKQLQSGDDLTVVGWGNTLEICAQALRQFGDRVSADVFDLRSIVPWDRETIARSVKRTGRLVVVQEDTENCSVGQMIISTLTGDAEIWAALKAPPALVSKTNVMIGYNPILEFAALPDVKRAAAAMQRVLAASTPGTRVTYPAPTPLPAAPTRSLQEIHTFAPTATEPAAPPAIRTLQANEITLRVPILGEGIRSARIVALTKEPGDSISPDQPLCELETDKAVYPVEAAGAGTLHEWLVKVGDTVEIGEALAVVHADSPEAWSSGHAQTAPAHHGSPQANGEHEHGIAPALSPAITKRLGKVVPVYLTVNARFENVRVARRHAKARNEPITPSLIAAWCIVRAIEKQPSFRREVLADDSIRQWEDFDLGLAVALDGDRLVTAVIPQANRLAWGDFVRAYNHAVDEARGGRLHGEIHAPVILTSLGGFGVRTGQPILVPPAVGTIFIGEAHYEMQGDAEGGWPSAQEVVALSLTFDHRVVNGAGAAAFIQDVKRLLEHFETPA